MRPGSSTRTTSPRTSRSPGCGATRSTPSCSRTGATWIWRPAGRELCRLGFLRRLTTPDWPNLAFEIPFRSVDGQEAFRVSDRLLHRLGFDDRVTADHFLGLGEGA